MASGLTFETLTAQSGSEILVPAGHVFEVNGNIKIPNWTDSTRPTGVIGMIGYNTQQGYVEFYDGTEWTKAGEIGNDGSSAERAALNGQDLVQNFPILGNGVYWIKTPSMPNALQMYVDFEEDGGGYDFYPTMGNGISHNYITDNHTGTALGLSRWAPRSKYCWRAAAKAVSDMDSANFSAYWASMGFVYKPSGGGNYTGCIMRHSSYGGNNCGDWRVEDGGRWWFRDSTYSEPNGDYNGNGYQFYRSGLDNPYSLGDLAFNDAGAASSGTRYLLSTNVKT
jgi:hypothetical protein